MHPEWPRCYPAFLALSVVILDTDLQDGAGLRKRDLPDVPSAGFEGFLQREARLGTIDNDDEPVIRRQLLVARLGNDLQVLRIASDPYRRRQVVPATPDTVEILGVGLVHLEDVVVVVQPEAVGLCAQSNYLYLRLLATFKVSRVGNGDRHALQKQGGGRLSNRQRHAPVLYGNRTSVVE